MRQEEIEAIKYQKKGEDEPDELLCPECGNPVLLASGTLLEVNPDEEPYASGKLEKPRSGEEYFQVSIPILVHFCENCNMTVDAWMEEYEHVAWNDFKGTEGIEPPTFLFHPPSDPFNNAKRLAHILMMKQELDPAYYRLFLILCAQPHGQAEYIYSFPNIDGFVVTSDWIYQLQSWNLISFKTDVGYYDEKMPKVIVRKHVITANKNVIYPNDFAIGLSQ
jgi:hypothetical protein